MQKAKLILKLNVFNTVPLVDVTPPEAVLLRRIHEKPGNEDALQNIVVTGDVSVRSADEAQRLRSRYPKDAFTKAFPGDMPKLPTTFEEVGLEVEGKHEKVKA